jgi:replication-associated recombination protein RarA
MLKLTASKLKLGEVVSALQKHIRRAEEEKALVMAYEMLPHYRHYLWKRLRVIAMEDIGQANPVAMILTESLHRQFDMFWMDSKEGPCRLCLANAVIYLCRSEKSRLANNMQLAVAGEILNESMDTSIDESTLDIHTQRGRKKGRGVKHFRKHAAKLNPKTRIEDVYEDRAYKVWKGKPVNLGWFD